MDKKYRVVFLGLGNTENNFKSGMSRLGVTSVRAESIIKKAPVILKQGMHLKDARKYAEAVQRSGGKVKILVQGFFKDTHRSRGACHIEPMENFIMCPRCGHKQLKKEACVKCGFIF